MCADAEHQMCDLNKPDSVIIKVGENILNYSRYLWDGNRIVSK